jgi:ribosomal protein S18 acetylase RimI-like enzyme
MEIVELSKEQLNEIEPLWLELNVHHSQRSKNFGQHFESYTFEKRSKSLLAAEDLKVFAAKTNSSLVGYCIASLNNGAGEIDSIYIKQSFQNASLGKQLTNSAISWLTGLGCKKISVSVAEGNEEAIPFYEKLGFKRRFHVLQIENS